MFLFQKSLLHKHLGACVSVPLVHKAEQLLSYLNKIEQTVLNCREMGNLTEGHICIQFPSIDL